MRLEIEEDPTLYRNNKIKIALKKNVKSQRGTKYINVQYHYIRKLVSKKKPTIKWISGSQRLTDRISKALPT